MIRYRLSTGVFRAVQISQKSLDRNYDWGVHKHVSLTRTVIALIKFKKVISPINQENYNENTSFDQ